MGEVDPRPPSRRNSFGTLSVDEGMDSDVVECESVVQVQVHAEPALAVGRAGHISPIVSIQRPPKRSKLRNDFAIGSGNDIEEEEFTLVQHKKNKTSRSNRLLREPSVKQYSGPQCFEVCLSSYQLLPKQIGLAKLLKAENINNVKYIKYKSPYKVHILFENREDADVLLTSNSFSSAGLRCYLTSEVGTTYGVVRNLEMETTEEEMMNAFKCEFEIVAVKRLKRASESGNWVLSETVRFAFKGPLLPDYIYGYDCRFKVEPFTFPVTQCSVCWKFGHLTRSCPTKKTVCPKCGKNHANCETIKFRCINCKGEHMAFDKSCPVFLKERDIRAIMSKDNSTYKNAVSKYIEKKRHDSSTDKVFEFGDQPRSYEFTRPGLSYSQSLSTNLTQKEVRNQELQECSDSIEESDNDSKEDSCEENVQSKNTTNKNRRKNRGRKTKQKKSDLGKTEEVTVVEQQQDQGYISRIISKAKNILCSKESLEGKVRMVLQFVLEEVMALIVKTMSNGEALSKIISLFHDG